MLTYLHVFVIGLHGCRIRILDCFGGGFVLPNYVTNSRDYLWLYYFMIAE